MAADNLENPLGQKRGQAQKRLLPAPALPIVGGALALFAAVFIWVNVAGEKNGGEPFAVAPIKQVEMPKSASKSAPSMVAQSAPEESAKNTPPGARTVTIIDGKSGARQEVVIKDSDSEAAAGNETKSEPKNAAIKVDARLVEISRHGPIPKVGDDGAVFDAPDLSLAIASPVPLASTGRGVRGEVTLSAGESVTFTLSEPVAGGAPPPMTPPEAEAVVDTLPDGVRLRFIRMTRPLERD